MKDFIVTPCSKFYYVKNIYLVLEESTTLGEPPTLDKGGELNHPQNNLMY
jgi:hypothetical protein